MNAHTDPASLEAASPLPPATIIEPRSGIAPDLSVQEGGKVEVGGNTYMTNPKGALVPLEVVKAQDILQDEVVRKIISHALPLHGIVGRFKGHTQVDVANFMDLVAQEYGAKIGGVKGNISLVSYDGTLKVVVQVQDRLTFGPELQAAKALVDEFLLNHLADKDPITRGLVTHAFRTDNAGQVNRAELFRLLRHEIEHPAWIEAMRALKDSIRPEGSKEYVRFYRRADARAAWQVISIDLAAA